MRPVPLLLSLVVVASVVGAVGGCAGPTTGPGPASTTAGPLPTLPSETAPAQQTVDTAGYEPLSRALLEQRRTVEQLVDRIDGAAGIDSTERSREVLGEVVPALQTLLDDAGAVRPSDPRVLAVHQHLITSLQIAITAFTDLGQGLAGDQARFERGRQERHQEAGEFTAWVDGLRGLYGGTGG